MLISTLGGVCFGQFTNGTWNEVIGKKVVDNRGASVGRVIDSAIDVENGRCLAFLVATNGFLGLGQKVSPVPPGALRDGRNPRILVLNMNKATFANAPTYKLSKTVGPPNPTQVAAVYEYFGQKPYFTTKIVATPSNGQKLEQLGYVQRAAHIINLPVENLRGVRVGYVWGLRELNTKSGLISGVIISQNRAYGTAGFYKIVHPQALRYTPEHDRLRINDYEQEFANSPDFAIMSSGHLKEMSPARPGGQASSLVQGIGDRDKQMTEEIVQRIGNDPELSHYAQNVNVGTVNGKTIIRGRVESVRDRDIILGYASNVAGPSSVTNKLEVKRITASETMIDAPVVR